MEILEEKFSSQTKYVRILSEMEWVAEDNDFDVTKTDYMRFILFANVLQAVKNNTGNTTPNIKTKQTDIFFELM